ncbi:MAG: hypothetical protein Q4B70_00895 [Lachnospiraceae bacterium]|nr:hypothetical protein [Lachnospiraceae bacterium]
MVNIYIDSDVKGVKGKGWYGYVLEWKQGNEILLTTDGFAPIEDTRNRIFLKATVEAMSRIKRPTELYIYEPCGYVSETIRTGKLEEWFLQAWIKGDGHEIKNKDLWTQLLPLVKQWKPQMNTGTHCYSEWIRQEIEKKKEGNKEDGIK